MGAAKSLANYSFYMGATNDNLDELRKVNQAEVCGIKVFMGSSTGNMLVDDIKTLTGIFAEIPMLIATHCEDESVIQANKAKYIARYGEDLPVHYHPYIPGCGSLLSIFFFCSRAGLKIQYAPTLAAYIYSPRA